MYALLLGAATLGLRVALTRFQMSNHDGEPLPWEFPLADRPHLLHYCYGDAAFDKRDHATDHAAAVGVWTHPTAPGTVAHELVRRIRAAGAAFGLPDPALVPTT
jgi:hypothetical protein